ncbi:MAG: CoA-binding protein [Xenococcaceae cyanobacterium MO_188.B29]|nr:CoA-binding protein [Xenococcaceae cyanobacterium MO_188.B29]
MYWKLPEKVIIQGIDRPNVAHYTTIMKAYGTNIAAGISAGKGGEEIGEIPVFNLVEEAIEKIGKIDATLIFAHPYEVLDAVREAIAAEIKFAIILTPGIPPLDMVRLQREAQVKGTLILGAGSKGIVIPEKICLGALQPEFYQPGNIALISYSENLTYEVALELNRADLGQSMIVHLGNEAILGSTYQQWLSIFKEDKNTEAIVLIGQPDYYQEQAAAYYADADLNKPVITYLAGLYTPRERTFLDATTIMANQLSYSVPSVNTDKRAMATLKKSGIKVAKNPSEVIQLLQKIPAFKS